MPGTAAAVTYNVTSISGPLNYTTIAGAVSNATDGDTILVYPGTYTENVDVKKELMIISESGNSDDTIVQAANLSDYTLYVNADDVNISGFTVKGALSTPKAGIYLDGVLNNTISNNTVTDNYIGIYLRNSSNTTVSNNTVNLNVAYGIVLSTWSSTNTLYNNNVSNNKHGIYLDHSVNNMVISHNVHSTDGFGIRLLNSSNNTLADNNVSDSFYGINLVQFSNRNVLFGNIVCNSTRYGLPIEHSSNNNTIYNNYFNNTDNIQDDGTNTGNIWNSEILIYTYNGSNYGNYTGNYYSDYVGADSNGDGIGDIPYSSDNYPIMFWPVTTSTISGSTITVDDDPGSNFTKIQYAVDYAKDSYKIIVYPGTYEENVDVNKELTIISESGNPDDTIVQAGDSHDHIFHVTAYNVTISGFNVTGATGDLKSGIYLHGFGGCVVTNNIVSNNSRGILLEESSDNTLSNNNASNNMHGIYLRNTSNTMISDNTVDLNIGYGIVLSTWSSANTLYNNDVSNNKYGIYLDHSINNTVISHNVHLNDGIGIRLFNSSNNILADNNVSNSYYGIYLIKSSGNSLTENVIDSIQAHGILLELSNLNILKDNIASKNTNGIQLFKSSNNNTLCGNNASFNYDYGIFLSTSRDNKLRNNTASHNNDYGIVVTSSDDNQLNNNTINSNLVSGIWLFGSSNNTLINNILCNNNVSGIAFKSTSPFSNNNNSIYNNYFNNTNNTQFVGANIGNLWNTTKTAGTSIVGGPFIGGNFWATPEGRGFSQTCDDTDWDGFCDLPYDFDGNTDYLPLAEYILATIDIDPDTLNIKSKLVTTYIELPGSYSVEDIDVSTVTLTNEDLFDSPAYAFGEPKIGDHDRNGVPDLKVKFSVSGLKPVPEGEYICTVAGELVDGQKFKGTDTITVVTKGKKQK